MEMAEILSDRCDGGGGGDISDTAHYQYKNTRNPGAVVKIPYTFV